MFNKEALKITAFTSLFFLTFLGYFNTEASAQSYRNNCRIYGGKYYIVDEVYKACGVITDPNQCPKLSTILSYATENICVEKSIEKYGCTPQIEGSVYYSNSLTGNALIYAGNTISIADAVSCLNTLQKNESPTRPFCEKGIKFSQCKCSKTLLGEAGAIGSVIGWITGSDTYYCYLKPVIGNNYVEMGDVKIYSPLQMIKVVSNFLFYIAVMIFLLNFINIGSKYIQSEGAPDELKQARQLLNNTIGGMIFFILVTGLISYLMNVF